MMSTYRATAQVIRTWILHVEAESLDEAHNKLNRMQSYDIEANGSLHDVATDYFEVVRQGDPR